MFTIQVFTRPYVRCRCTEKIRFYLRSRWCGVALFKGPHRTYEIRVLTIPLVTGQRGTVQPVFLFFAPLNFSYTGECGLSKISRHIDWPTSSRTPHQIRYL